MFHELAHIALEHGGCAFGARSVAELEAESVAWICCDAVGIVSDGYSFASWPHGLAVVMQPSPGSESQRSASSA